MHLGAQVAALAGFMRAVSLAVMIALTAIMGLSCVLAAAGFLPWLTFTARFETFVVPQAGLITQIALTSLMVALCFFVPAANRMLALERTHRNFRINMNDIGIAYRAAHAADRAGVFTARSEFDGVRERMEHLQQHPDLHLLEADLLTVAAQMSEKSRHIARVYSNENLTRAQAFLAQRQQDIDAFAAQLKTATALTTQLRRWQEMQQTERGIQQAQVERIQRDLLDLMPELGFDLEEDDDDALANVVSLPTKPLTHPTH